MHTVPSGVVKQGTDTYEWRPCTPPSTWADVVLFSNFSSPEYIMALRGKDTCYKPGRVQGICSAGTAGTRVTGSSSCGPNDLYCAPKNQAGSCPWHLGSPCRGISSPGESPSSLAQDITGNSTSAAVAVDAKSLRVPGHSTGCSPHIPSHLQVIALMPTVMPYGNTLEEIPYNGAHLWRPQVPGPWRCAQPSGSLRRRSRAPRTSWRTRTPCTPPWPGDGRTPALRDTAHTASAAGSSTPPSQQALSGFQHTHAPALRTHKSLDTPSLG
uniref:Uncharacterized protein n=1 Tax=Cyanoderma ruficeps TaxID=181631 RepID=A0A8C3NQS3_9PASS